MNGGARVLMRKMTNICFKMTIEQSRGTSSSQSMGKWKCNQQTIVLPDERFDSHIRSFSVAVTAGSIKCYVNVSYLMLSAGSRFPVTACLFQMMWETEMTSIYRWDFFLVLDKQASSMSPLRTVPFRLVAYSGQGQTKLKWPIMPSLIRVRV